MIHVILISYITYIQLPCVYYATLARNFMYPCFCKMCYVYICRFLPSSISHNAVVLCSWDWTHSSSSSERNQPTVTRVRWQSAISLKINFKILQIALCCRYYRVLQLLFLHSESSKSPFVKYEYWYIKNTLFKCTIFDETAFPWI